MVEEYKFLFKTVAIGEGAVGKTALTLRFAKGFFTENYKMTIGVDFFVKTVNINTKQGPIKVKLQIFDTGGQEYFNKIRPAYYRGALGALIVFDLTRRITFENISKWIVELQQNIREDIPIVLVGNKSDLTNLRNVDRQKARNLAESLNCEYIETSAKTGGNVIDMFERLAINIIEGLSARRLSEYKYEKIERKKKIEKKLSCKHCGNSFSSDYQFCNKCGAPVSDQHIELINQRVEEILTMPPENGKFRFLIFGDENSQKPLLSKLLSVEKISWPPKTHTILYNTLEYTMKIDVQEYQFQLYFLSNLKRLKKNSKLFTEACKQTDGVVIFYDPYKSKGFAQAAGLGKKLRENDSDLEIILTTGSEDHSFFSLYHELESLEEEYRIENNDDYNSLISEMLVNILKRKKKIKNEIEYRKTKLKELQDQLCNQRVDREKCQRDLMQFALSMEKPQKIKAKMPELAKENLIFISYSHKDKFWLERVKTHLTPLEKFGKINMWDDTRLKAGDEWREELTHALDASKAAILLVSENFLASKFITENELPPLLDAARKKGTVILPLYISPCRYDLYESLSRFQAVNDPNTETLIDLSEGEQNRILVKLSRAVEDAFKDT
ncbi:MAG: GTP-binding protein [Candidatus Thorarchaeota archaeon]